MHRNSYISSADVNECSEVTTTHTPSHDSYTCNLEAFATRKRLFINTFIYVRVFSLLQHLTTIEINAEKMTDAMIGIRIRK